MKTVFQNMTAIGIGICSFFPLLAQPTLTNSVFPGIGQTVITSEADTLGVLEGSAGANQTWDFSGLIPLAGISQDTSTYIAAGGTPYAMDFPTANLANQSLGEDYYSYIKTETNEMTFLGAAGPDLLYTYSDPISFLKTPMNFNGSFSDDYAATFEVDSAIYYETGTLTTQYDAYGSLTAPAGSFSNAIRLKTTILERDSLSTGMGYFLDEVTETNYEWYAAGVPNPIVSISYSEGVTTIVFPPFPPIINPIPRTKSVSYLSGTTTGIQDKAPAISIRQLSPNPASEQLRVSLVAASGLEKVQVLVVNEMGQVLRRQEESLQEGLNGFLIPVSQLPAGAYWLQVQAPQGVWSTAWIKQ